MEETQQEDSSGEEGQAALEKMKKKSEELRIQNEKLIIEMNNTTAQIKALTDKQTQVK